MAQVNDCTLGLGIRSDWITYQKRAGNKSAICMVASAFIAYKKTETKQKQISLKWLDSEKEAPNSW